MALQGFDHLVLLVADVEAAVTQWQSRLGMPLAHRASAPGIQQAFFTLQDRTFIELIAPDGDDSPLTAALDKRGEGVHVLALAVDDLAETVADLTRSGTQLIGAGTDRVFIHPKSANGVMIQLWPASRPHRWRDNNSNQQETA